MLLKKTLDKTRGIQVWFMALDTITPLFQLKIFLVLLA
jgi:hypothetical protein